MTAEKRQGEKATPEFRQWFEKNLEIVKQKSSHIIFERGEEHVPVMLVFEKASGPEMPRLAVLPMHMFMNSEDGKDIVFGLARKTADVERVEGVMLVIEAWFLAGEGKSYDHKALPSKHKDRREGLMVTALRGGMQLLALLVIDRKAKTLTLEFMQDPMDTGKDTTAWGRAITNKPVEH